MTTGYFAVLFLFLVVFAIGVVTIGTIVGLELAKRIFAWLTAVLDQARAQALRRAHPMITLRPTRAQRATSRDLLLDSERMLSDLDAVLREARPVPTQMPPPVVSEKQEPKLAPPEPEPGPRKIVL